MFGVAENFVEEVNGVTHDDCRLSYGSGLPDSYRPSGDRSEQALNHCNRRLKEIPVETKVNESSRNWDQTVRRDWLETAMTSVARNDRAAGLDEQEYSV